VSLSDRWISAFGSGEWPHPDHFFDATVTCVDDEGIERSVKIVGIDEANSAAGEVSRDSPIVHTLLKAFEGDVLKLVRPERVEEIEVLRVTYPEPSAASGPL
jgi:transcription elongation factor GreB